MGKQSKKHTQHRRAAAKQRRRTRQARQAERERAVVSWDGWMDPDDPMPDRPPESAFDTTHCPVGARSTGCGASEGLRPVVSTFSRPGGYDAACTTLCADCDGRSFLDLFDHEQLHQAHRAHTQHLQAGATD